MAFVTTTTIESRLGRALTTPELAQVQSLIPLAQGVVETYVGKVEADFDTIPAVVSGAAVTIVIRALANPTALSSRSESIGSYSLQESFGRDLASELTLTEGEVRVLRRAVWGTNTGSAQLAPTLLDDMREQFANVAE